MEKEIKEPGINYFFPNPVVLVTCMDKTNKPNIITIGAIGIMCAKPPMVGIAVSPKRHSHRLIMNSGEFVINFPTKSLLREVDFCGNTSGKEIDKFAETGLKKEFGRMKTPMIRECPINFECEVKEVLSFGSHDWIMGEVVAVYLSESPLKKDNAFVGIHGRYFEAKEELNPYGFSISQ